MRLNNPSSQGKFLLLSDILTHIQQLLTPAYNSDPAILVQDWVSRGEGQQLEYKLDLTESERILHSVAAFANGDGGIILIGVPDKHPSIVGYPGDVDAAKRRFISSVRDNLTAMPPISIEQVEVEGKRILVISVGPGDAPPYGMKSKHSSSPATFYIRHDSSNYIAQAHEIHAMVRQRLAPVQSIPTGDLGIGLLADRARSATFVPSRLAHTMGRCCVISG